MERIQSVLLLCFLSSTICYSQLLIKPSVSVEDCEIALTNTDHLSKILKEHNFEYSVSGASGFNQPETMSNALYPDLRILRSENWVLKDSLGKFILIIDMLNWEQDYAPQPDIIKTIRIMVNKDSEYVDQLKTFLEKIKIKYPNKSNRYFRNTEQSKQFGEPMTVFTNGTNIEVRTEVADPRYINFFSVGFDLMK
jgi:hypothetical protein